MGSCLPKKEFEVINKIATVQGYGVTESGTKGNLLETNVTVITNKYCKEILQANVTKDQNNAKKILKALPLGLDYGLMCAQGIYKADKGIYTGSCKGDSGGPLTQRDEEDRTTLIGIVSGGIDCGKGFPGWYTRVEYYKVWIQCIIDKSLQFNNGNATAEEICIPYKTGTFARADNEPADNEIFGDSNAGLSGATPDYYSDADSDIFGDYGDTSANADEEIFGDYGDDEIFGGETPVNADDEIFGEETPVNPD